MTEVLSNIQTYSVKLTTRNDLEIDITDICLVFNIYQSLLSRKFLTGRMILLDTSDLIVNLPIIGFEKVTISVSNSYDTSEQIYDFRIYKIDRDSGPLKNFQKMKILNVYLYTEEEFRNYTKISKKFSGTGEFIIQELISNHLLSSKDLNSDTDSSSIDFVSNFWDVDKCIDYVSRKTEGSYSDYIFYENNHGYNFKSLSQLYEEQAKTTIKFDISKSGIYNIDNAYLHQFNGYFDDLLWRKKGLFGTTKYTILDEYGYQLDEKEISDLDSEIYIGGLNRSYNDERDSLNNIYTDRGTPDDINLIRTTHLNLVSRYPLVVNLDGDIDRNVGELYELDFPALENESTVSDSFSGNWLALEINTSIYNNNEFKQNILLAKNSLFNNKKLNTY